jgi:putative endonuclease
VRVDGAYVAGMARDPRRHLGELGERLACEHLERLGFRIVDRNYRTRWGEIDVVACDEGTIVFCEVKTRRPGSSRPWDALGPAKQRQVRRMAGKWLVERTDRPRAAELRFDAIGVTIDARGTLTALDHLEGAF